MLTGETNVDPEVVTPAAARLVLQAEGLRNAIHSLHQDLQGLHGCWGTDEAGRQFEESYFGEGGTAANNAADNIASGCTALCESVEALAENAGVSAYVSQYEDETSHEDIIAAYDEQIEEIREAQQEAQSGEGPTIEIGGSEEGGGQTGPVVGSPSDPFAGREMQQRRLVGRAEVQRGELEPRRLFGHAVARRGGPEFRYRAVSRASMPPLFRTVTDRDREYYGLSESREGGEVWALGASRSELAARRELAAQLQTAIDNERPLASSVPESTEGTQPAEGFADEHAGGVEARFAHRVVERPEPAEATTGDQEPPAGNTETGPPEPTAEDRGPAGADAPPTESHPIWEALHWPLRRMMARRVTPDPGGEAAGSG